MQKVRKEKHPEATIALVLSEEDFCMKQSGDDQKAEHKPLLILNEDFLRFSEEDLKELEKVYDLSLAESEGK